MFYVRNKINYQKYILLILYLLLEILKILDTVILESFIVIQLSIN